MQYGLIWHALKKMQEKRLQSNDFAGLDTGIRAVW